MYLYTNRKMESLGYDNYEISNYAKTTGTKAYTIYYTGNTKTFRAWAWGAWKNDSKRQKNIQRLTQNPKTWHMEIQTEQAR